MADLTADRRAPMISIPPSSDDDDMLICGACKDAADELASLRRENDRLRQDRSDALNVRSREGLLASEWVARTGKAERELAEARELLGYSRTALMAVRYEFSRMRAYVVANESTVSVESFDMMARSVSAVVAAIDAAIPTPSVDDKT
jgi:hypothetical protein